MKTNRDPDEAGANTGRVQHKKRITRDKCKEEAWVLIKKKKKCNYFYFFFMPNNWADELLLSLVLQERARRVLKRLG